MKNLLLILTCCCTQLILAQTYVMSNGGSASSCSGTFLDPGGNGNYAGGNLANMTYTICNPNAGQPLYMDFNIFNLWDNGCLGGLTATRDYLRIYDGPNASSPQIGEYRDQNTPSVITATSGCFTFVFDRNNVGFLSLCSSNGGDIGWSAEISCVPFPPNGENCVGALPFCTALNYNFPNLTNSSSQAGPNYGCLGTQPNPIWYYMQVDQAGSFQINMNQTSTLGVPIDVDFAMWGPYTSVAAGCTAVMGGGVAPIQCSYSTAASETIGIGLPGGTGGGASTPPASNVNDFYLVLLTNFNGSAGFIDFNQTGGTGIADCSVLSANCFMTSLNANIGPCEFGSVYTLTGDVTFNDSPATGNLIIEVTSGANTYTQTIPTPLTNGAITAFSIANIPADGLAANVQAYFSAEPTCSIDLDYTATVGCPCNAEIGTFTTALTGQTATNYVLCYGDQLDINPAGGFVAPNQVLVGTPPAYSPHISWLVYTCPPTLGLIPSSLPSQDVAADPCLIGIVGNGALAELNDQYWLNAYPGQFTNNTVYFVPITMYNNTLYSYVNTTLPCYEMGPTYAVQYLPDFTFTKTSDCATGTVTGTFTGGLPAVNATQFAAVAGSLTPATANFVNTTCANNGTIQIGGLTNGQAYSFEVADGNGCTVTVSGTFTGGIPATLTYADDEYCTSETDPSPTIVGQQGGSYSSTAGLVINTTTGVIDLSATTPGSYTVSYNTNINPCPVISTFVITINGLPTVVASADVTVCAGVSASISASGANTYSWSPGALVGTPQSVTPATTTTYTVTGTDVKGCVNTDQVIVNVNPAPVISAGLDQYVCVGASVTLNGSINPANVAATYSWNNGISNNIAFSPTTTTTYTVTGTLNGCTSTDAVLVTVYALPTILAGNDQTICIGGNVTLTGNATASSASPVAYTWNNGVNNNVSFAPVTTVIYTVTGTDANNCVNTDAVTVNVNALPNVNAGADQSVCDGLPITLSASGATTYVWSTGTANNQIYTPSATGPLTVTGTDINGCVNTDVMNVTLNINPVPSFTSNINTGCSPLTITFTNTTANSSICNWTFGDGTTGNGCTTVTHIFNEVGCYDIALNTQDNSTCIGQTTQQNMICVQPDPVAEFIASPAVLTQTESTSQMLNSSTGAISYVWNFDDFGSSTEVSPFHDFPYDNPGNYTVQLIATSQYGCRDTTTALVIVNEELIYYIPNTFTPDSDNFNEDFKPIFTSGYDPFKYTLYIYNRWGELIFESRDSSIGWNGLYNGTIVQDGTYIWKIEFKTKANDARKQLIGHVNVLK
jgi:gliding motility-associated-like protein